MVTYKKIQVSNYKTISYAELDFEPGIYKVLGNNLDSRYTSNGSGKTTLLQAMTLCFYNRDISGVVLDHLSNRATKKGYCISVDMLVNDKVVNVTNDRQDPKKIKVTIDGDVVSHGVTNSLPVIEELLGMGFDTFKLTHYITSSTILQLTQNLSQPTLFNDILHMVEIQELDKALLQVSKAITSSLDDTTKKLNSVLEREKLQELQTRFDRESLEDTLGIAEEELGLLESRYLEVHSVLKADLAEYNTTLAQLEQSIDNTKNSLKNGVCSLCNSILIDRSNLKHLNTQLDEYNMLHNKASGIRETTINKVKNITKKYLDARQELTTSINKLKQDIGIATEVTSLAIIDINEAKNTLESLKQQLDTELKFTTTARKEIKSGKVTKEIMDKFFKVIEYKLKQYSELINLEHFKIKVVNDKLGMAIILEQNGMQVPVDSMSNGEKTRLSLLILISMLDAMKSVTDSNDNYLVFDEASSSFDKSGIGELEKLFAFLKNLGQSCFIITHGSEMDQVPYDKELIVTKQQGKSTVELRSLK